MLASAETALLESSRNNAVTQEKDSDRLNDKSICIVVGKITSVQHPEKDRRIGISEYEVKVVEVLKGTTKLNSFGREKDFKVQINRNGTLTFIVSSFKSEKEHEDSFLYQE